MLYGGCLLLHRREMACVSGVVFAFFYRRMQPTVSLSERFTERADVLSRPLRNARCHSHVYECNARPFLDKARVPFTLHRRAILAT